MDDDPENFPLVERFHKAEYLARELSEHLRQAFLPKLSSLRHASKVFDVAKRLLHSPSTRNLAC